MEKITDGIWERFVPGGQTYDAYKFAVTGADGVVRLKADPYAFHAETRPGTASKLYTIEAMPGGTRHGAKSATDSPSTPRR